MDDHNPLVRALALRTISYIHVREFVEATVHPVKRLMVDIDPYVRKTAAFCVAKLYDHHKKMVESSDLIDRLNKMLKDENPTVVASVLAALVDIWERSESISLTIDYASASKVVSVLPDCSEYVVTTISNLSALTNRYIGGARPIFSSPSCLMYQRIRPKLYSWRSGSHLGCHTRTPLLC
jgi:vesicle coat complex subunit